MMKTWEEIPEDDQKLLIEWYNVVEEQIDDNDRAKLAKLYFAGQFHHWNCPECGEPIIYGEPSNWDDFQGVHESDGLGELCADCGQLYLRLKRLAGGE
jgi:hypothetical protein